MFNKIKTIISKPKFTTGFTLVELLVTISIFAILTGVVLFNQTKFNSTILLTNLAYDTALTIRQAQTYGINIKEFGSSKFVPYGVHFDITDPVNNKSFILFADTNYDYDTERGDGLYNGSNGAEVPEPSRCEVDMGCVNRYSIKRGNYIGELCFVNDDGTDDCGVKTLDIVFQRPNPDAHIVIDGGTDYDGKVKIKLMAAGGGSERIVVVQSNGLIQIGDN